MLKVDIKYVRQLRDAIDSLSFKSEEKLFSFIDDTDIVIASKKTLLDSLREAMRLEASTIPPYLVAAWSLKYDQHESLADRKNKYVQDVIMSVAKEEMLHMMAVANIIAAMGENPQINSKDVVLNWGTDKLPIGGVLIPSLEPFTEDVLEDLFMEIEKPLDPKHYRTRKRKLPTPAAAFALDRQYATIGQFYDAIIDLINALPDDIFKNEQYYQIDFSRDSRIGTIDHKPIKSFTVRNSKQAINILEWIVDQGEGTKKDPMTDNDEPAHYFRFAGILMKGELIAVPKEEDPLGYVYDQVKHPIDCDYSAVYQFEKNPKMSQFDESSEHYQKLKKFNEIYMEMFELLQNSYETKQNFDLADSIAIMRDMTLSALDILKLKRPSICPSFEWIE